MRRNISMLSVLLLLVLIVGFLWWSGLQHYRSKILGIYDPDSRFSSTDGIYIQSGFFSWDVGKEKILEFLSDAKLNNKIPLITLEPWQESGKNTKGDELLSLIIAGKYNTTIDNVCKQLANEESPVLIRWGHEMELGDSRYPWTGASPEKYKNAYISFVEKCASWGDNLYFVWSPAGENGLEKYWPGDKYVDYIGLSVYSFDKWEIKNIGHQRSFDQIFRPKYERVSSYNKPVIIAEMGVTGSNEYKRLWLENAAKDITKYKALIGLVYFSSKDVHGAWDSTLGIPDWRITYDDLQPFRLDKITIEDSYAALDLKIVSN